MRRMRSKRVPKRPNPYWFQNNPSLTHREATPFDETLGQSFEEGVLAEVLRSNHDKNLHNLLTLAIVVERDSLQAAPEVVKCVVTPDPKVELTYQRKCGIHDFVDIELGPPERVKLSLNPAGTSIGWDGVPRRRDERPRSTSTPKLPTSGPVAPDGIPIRDHRRATSPDGFPKATVKGLRSRLNYVSRFAIDPMLGLGKNNNIKMKWLFSNANNGYYKENAKPSIKTNDTAEVKFKLQPYDKLLANNKFGAWGLAPLQVEVAPKREKAKYSCPPECTISLYTFQIEDIANWWQGTHFPFGNTTKRKVRDLIMSNLPIAKLFAVGWPPKHFRERLMVAHKNPLLKHSLHHNKEYCPTAFTVGPGGRNSFYAFHQQRMKWVRFPDLCYLPLDIVGMLGGEGGLLLLYGNARPKSQHPCTSHVPPWNHPQLSHATNPPQHLLVVCNPITRQHAFLPPVSVSLRFISAHMSVSRCSDNYTIHLMGWYRRTDVPGNRLELRVAYYISSEKSWFEHHKPCRLVRSIGQPPFTQNYDTVLPLVKDEGHKSGTLYTVGEHAPDPTKPFEFKHAVVSYNLRTLQWDLHPWILDQPLPPSVPSDPPLVRSDPPAIVECNGDLFGVARCFEGTRAFIQVHKLGAVRGDDGIRAREFVKHGKPMPAHYFHMNYPRSLYPYESPLRLNCVSGTGNLWVASPNQCMVMFFNVRLGRWSNITSMKLENEKSRTHHLGNWAFEPAIHAQVEG